MSLQRGGFESSTLPPCNSIQTCRIHCRRSGCYVTCSGCDRHLSLLFIYIVLVLWSLRFGNDWQDLEQILHEFITLESQEAQGFRIESQKQSLQKNSRMWWKLFSYKVAFINANNIHVWRFPKPPYKWSLQSLIWWSYEIHYNSRHLTFCIK